MLPITNLILNRGFKIRNFEEDKIATLKANPGLRYLGKFKDFFKFSGNFYLTNSNDELIEYFEIVILVDKTYPNTFPLVSLLEAKIEKTDDYHMDKSGLICFEHTYISNTLTAAGLRLYDFVNYYLPKYFSWALVKKYGDSEMLQEWGHKENGTRELYETLFATTEKEWISNFLENYIKAFDIRRNDLCYCGSEKKLKHCHYEAALFLKNTAQKDILKDICLFQ
jgi:hypothetical protein